MLDGANNIVNNTSINDRHRYCVRLYYGFNILLPLTSGFLGKAKIIACKRASRARTCCSAYANEDKNITKGTTKS